MRPAPAQPPSDKASGSYGPGGNTTAVSGVDTKVTIDTVFASSPAFTVGAGRITCTRAGTYRVSVSMLWSDMTIATGAQSNLWVNGAFLYRWQGGCGAAYQFLTQGEIILSLNVGDFLEIGGTHTAGANRTIAAFTGQSQIMVNQL